MFYVRACSSECSFICMRVWVSSTYIPPLDCPREVKSTKGEVISDRDLEVLLDRSNMMGESAAEPATFYRAKYNP